MVTIYRLEPSIPVKVVSKNQTGEAIAWFEYGKEDHLIWLVALDDSGECWQCPNPDIRFMNNYTFERNIKK